MNLSPTESKKLQIISWIKMYRNSTSEVRVSNYSYHCFFSGLPITKTLIVFPDEMETKGIITIDKPLHEIELSDLIRLGKRIQD